MFSVLSDMVTVVKSSSCRSTRTSSTGDLLTGNKRKMSLAKEKDDLRNLNDRFAAYIEKVRNLEEENKKLKNKAW